MMATKLIAFILALQDTPLASAAALSTAFLIGSLIFIPRPPLCVVAGLILGFAAVPVAAVSATLGAVLGFLIARHLLRSRFALAIGHRPRWRAVIEATNHEGWRLIALLRVASPIPGTVTNYLFGLTHIGLWPYTAATFLGQLPQIVIFVYLGAFGQSAFKGFSNSAINMALLVVGLGLTALAVALVARRARSRLEAGQLGESAQVSDR
jgi:uncharacterized membrane protein YdjX (TVP38/TMEM64 family)